MRDKKKGQEEIVGFVLVVVLVVVILVIFLGISLRNPQNSDRKSEAIYQFLDSLMEQTTECRLFEGRDLLSFDELIKECHESDSRCLSGESACDFLERSFTEVMNESWKVGEDYPIKGYELDMVYGVEPNGQQTSEEVLNISEGSCGSSMIGNSYWIPEFPGSITTTLKLCY